MPSVIIKVLAYNRRLKQLRPGVAGYPYLAFTLFLLAIPMQTYRRFAG